MPDLITPKLFRFFAELTRHNDRAWFEDNKARYVAEVRDPLLRFVEAFGPRLAKITLHMLADPRPVGGALFRIYRDTRFSKDKSPYKTHAGMYFPLRAGKDVHTPGFYLHLEPGGCFAAAGLWHGDAAALAKVRGAIDARGKDWKRARGKLPLGGDALTRPPRGYDASHPFLEDIKRKDFITSTRFSDREVTSPRFLSIFSAACRRMSPLPKFLASALDLAW